MADRINVNINRDDITRAAKIIHRAVVETGISARAGLLDASITIAESGRHLCKPSKKNRDILDNPAWKENKKTFAWARRQQRAGKAIPAEAAQALADANNTAPYLIRVLRQAGEPVMLPSYDLRDPRRVIERRGLARKLFALMVAALVNVKIAAIGAGKNLFRSKFGSVRMYETRFSASESIEMAIDIRLSYLQAAYPGIEQTMITRGLNRLEKKVQQDIERICARANAA